MLIGTRTVGRANNAGSGFSERRLWMFLMFGEKDDYEDLRGFAGKYLILFCKYLSASNKR